MPYVPAPGEVTRLRAAIDAAAFGEGERIGWLTGFVGLVVLNVVLALTGASVPGVLGSVFGFVILYWRLRGGHLRRRVQGDDGGLFGFGLATQEQRAFTALMFRYVLTGRNPLAERVEHDPFARGGSVSTQAAEEAPEEA